MEWVYYMYVFCVYTCVMSIEALGMYDQKPKAEEEEEEEEDEAKKRNLKTISKTLVRKCVETVCGQCHQRIIGGHRKCLDCYWK